MCSQRLLCLTVFYPAAGLLCTTSARWLEGREGVAATILREALRAPLNQIMDNAGVDYDYSMVDDGEGYNIKTGESAI